MSDIAIGNDSKSASTLREASEVVFSVRDRAELPKRICEAASRVMLADDASLMLPGGDGRLYIAYSNGLPPTVQAEQRVSIGTGVAGRVAAEREPAVLSGDIGTDPRFPGAVGNGRVRSSIVYPLHSGEQLLGVLNLNRVASSPPFEPSDLNRACVLASQIVLALEVQSLLRQLANAEKFRAIGQLAGSITHEVNNPIAYVTANLTYTRDRLAGLKRLGELFQTGAGKDELATCFEEVGGQQGLLDMDAALADAEAGAARVRDVVRDMRALSRTGESSSTAMVEAAVMVALRMTAAELRAVAEVDTSLSAGLMVSMALGRLSQVLVNLFTNAAYAMKSTDRERNKLSIRSARDGDFAVIEVRDTGEGIAPAHLPRLFEPFHTTKPADVGTGLGLATSLELVKSQGGTISVQSQLGQGATFTVRLPAADPSDEAEVATVAASTPVPTLVKPRILCVDDEEAICRAFSRCLADEYTVVTSLSAEAAMKHLETSTDFAAIVCDMIMPRISGMVFFESVTRRWPALAPRFVFVTGSLGCGDVRAFLAQVANHVVEKPVSARTLKEELRRIIEGLGKS